jgi:hypothetical protein
MSHTIYPAKFEPTINHQHVQQCTFTTGKSVIIIVKLIPAFSFYLLHNLEIKINMFKFYLKKQELLFYFFISSMID